MTAIVGFCSVSPSSSSESANELGSESSENSCVSSGKDCVLYDESLESVATENKTAVDTRHKWLTKNNKKQKFRGTVTTKANHSQQNQINSIRYFYPQ